MCQANSAGGITSDSAGKSDVDRGALECALMAQLKHPNVIAAFKSAQVPLPYEVSCFAVNYGRTSSLLLSLAKLTMTIAHIDSQIQTKKSNKHIQLSNAFYLIVQQS